MDVYPYLPLVLRAPWTIGGGGLYIFDIKLKHIFCIQKSRLLLSNDFFPVSLQRSPKHPSWFWSRWLPQAAGGNGEGGDGMTSGAHGEGRGGKGDGKRD